MFYNSKRRKQLTKMISSNQTYPIVHGIPAHWTPDLNSFRRLVVSVGNVFPDPKRSSIIWSCITFQLDPNHIRLFQIFLQHLLVDYRIGPIDSFLVDFFTNTIINIQLLKRCLAMTNSYMNGLSGHHFGFDFPSTLLLFFEDKIIITSIIIIFTNC